MMKIINILRNARLRKDIVKVLKKNLKWYVAFLSLLFAIIFTVDYFKGLNLEERYYTRDATTRVTAILNRIKLNADETGTEGDEQLAICQWYLNTFITDLGRFSLACDEFDKWRKEGGIFPYIHEFTITKAILLEGSNPVTVMVSGTIDGSSFVMRVPGGEQITWDQAPCLVQTYDFLE